MKELLPIQRPYYETLVGVEGEGAHRAWISLRCGMGKGVIAAHAATKLVQARSVRRVLYVAVKSSQHHVAREFSDAGAGCVSVLKTALQRARPSEAISVCTERMWVQGYDTWVKYSGFDLIILDMCRNPNFDRPTELAALRGTFNLGCKVWILGLNV